MAPKGLHRKRHSPSCDYCTFPLAVETAVAIFVNVPEMSVPRVVTAVMITPAIRAAISPYSNAVTARRSVFRVSHVFRNVYAIETSSSVLGLRLAPKAQLPQLG